MTLSLGSWSISAALLLELVQPSDVHAEHLLVEIGQGLRVALQVALVHVHPRGGVVGVPPLPRLLVVPAVVVVRVTRAGPVPVPGHVHLVPLARRIVLAAGPEPLG